MSIVVNKNKRIEIVSTEKLLTMAIQIPNFQRIINNKNRDDIVEKQLNNLKHKHIDCFVGSLIVIEMNGDKYLIDGQHRYSSLIELYSNGHNLKIPIEIINVSTQIEMIEYYNMINMHTPLPLFSDTINKIIPERASEYFQIKYPNIWSKKERTQRPLIWFNNFQESLGVITEELGLTDPQELILLVEKRNDIVSRSQINVKISENMSNKAKLNGFYLGLFKFISNNKYGYSWVKDVIDNY